MNYLAHLYLSANRPELAIGNFIADHVKGSMVEKFQGEVLDGIRLHRLIDSFTDSHPVVELSKARLRPGFRKYAPVIVDLYYDHFLARDWEAYHHQPLTVFADETYARLRNHHALLPERTIHMLNYMEPQNWLVQYASLEGLQRALTGLSRRTAFESNMETAHLFLQENYQAFEEEFNTFFPELRSFVQIAIEK